MIRQISIILFCLVARSISWSQATVDQPRKVFANAIDSMIRSQALEPATTSIIADSAYRSYIDERHWKDPSAIVYVNGWSVGITGSGTQQIIHVSGTVVSLKPPKTPEVFTISRGFLHAMDTVDEEESFWESVLQPTLVTLGAATIIALFFLIRS
jgi:hypothetical protein